MSDKTYTHESYAMIHGSRVSGRRFLFGSDAEHQHYITISIATGERVRSLSHDWYHDGKELIEVALTETQWAQFVSSLNASGTPCTLAHFQGKRIPETPAPPKVTSEFQAEIKELIGRTMKSLEAISTRLADVTQPNAKNLGKTELREIFSQVQSALMQIKNNLPFVENSFNESMEKKISKAVVEFEAFVNNRMRTIALDAMGKQLKQGAEETVDAAKLLGAGAKEPG